MSIDIKLIPFEICLIHIILIQIHNSKKILALLINDSNDSIYKKKTHKQKRKKTAGRTNTQPFNEYFMAFSFLPKMCTLFQKMKFRVCFLKMFRPLKV